MCRGRGASQESKIYQKKCQHAPQMKLKWPSETPWAPFLPCLASETEIDQKKYEKRDLKGRLFGALLALCAPCGGSYGGPSGQKEHPEGIQDKFCTHLKNIKIHRVFDGFWRSRLPSGAQNGGLEGLRGATWGSLGDSWEAFRDFFQHLNFEVDFWSAKRSV